MICGVLNMQSCCQSYHDVICGVCGVRTSILMICAAAARYGLNSGTAVSRSFLALENVESFHYNLQSKQQTDQHTLIIALLSFYNLPF